ncbi:hypothetical protein IQ07DRAFT_36197 [Pyrenochaeta sp. DS3sAY3a]|nr:hypothetical protein IQ07DRAFT_36197 [Pyrenochaeta sp. DS3sAY3a]
MALQSSSYSLTSSGLCPGSLSSHNVVAHVVEAHLCGPSTSTTARVSKGRDLVISRFLMEDDLNRNRALDLNTTQAPLKHVLIGMQLKLHAFPALFPRGHIIQAGCAILTISII